KFATIHVAGARIAWTWQDIEAAIYMGVALPTDMGMIARRIADRFHDVTTAKGNAQHKVSGLLSDQSTMTAYNSGSSVNWAGMADIYAKVAFVENMVRTVSIATNTIYSAGMFMFAPAYYRELEDTGYGNNQDKTALDFLENTYRRRGLVF